MRDDSFDSRMEQDIDDIAKTVRRQDESVQSQKRKVHIRPMPAIADMTEKKISDVHPPVQSPDEKEFVRQMVEKISHHQPQDLSKQIPTLDLANQILAQQRKIAALKRKSPSQNGSQQAAQPESAAINIFPAAPASPQQSIIADIVAREIEALCYSR